MWFRKKKSNPSQELRRMALDRQPSEVNLSPSAEHPHVFGVLMETGYPEAVGFAKQNTTHSTLRLLESPSSP